MRKLIEITQDNLIQCDNTLCDYVIKNITGDANEDTSHLVNNPCPKCGENLLSREDHDLGVRLLRVVNFINRWFSWMTIFLPKPKKSDTIYIHNHKGMKATKD